MPKKITYPLITFFSLGVVLLILFYRSLNPDLVLFSNDGPLPLNIHPSLEGKTGLMGLWFDFYWLGVNGGTFNFAPYEIFRAVMGAMFAAKWAVPFILILVGLSAAIWGWQMRLGRSVMLFAFAVMLNSTFFTYACWGLPGHALLVVYPLLAIAFITYFQGWFRFIFAGVSIGLGVASIPDIGAIYSLYFGAYVIVLSLLEKGKLSKRLGLGILRVGIVALIAVFASWRTLDVMINTQIKGVVGTAQDERTKEQQWDWATQWSLPKIETIRLLVPGFFGYRMDAPDGGNYWGEVGRTPGYEQHKQGFPRYSGAGDYPGLLVLAGAIWALASTFRRGKPEMEGVAFSDRERKIIWFWAGAALISLLLAWGRHAPFYQFIYHLPYFSTIRNPVKFMYPFALSILILFGYALLDWKRRYFDEPVVENNSGKNVPADPVKRFKQWFNQRAEPFEKKWVRGSQIILVLAVLGLMGVVGSRGSIVSYLKANDFGEISDYIIAHVITEMWFFLGFLIVTLGILITVIAGWWRGKKAVWGWAILTLVLVLDLGRANWPWIQYYNYKERYASNPVLDELKKQPPYYGRVSILARQFPLYNEWHQHHFLYYNIQCLEFAQLPRVPEDYAAYMGALQNNPLRLWELTNTRFFLAGSDTTEQLNQQLDPEYKRFQTVMQFGLIQNEEGAYGMQVGAGELALIEFPNVLPRAQLYRVWRVVDDEKALELLPDPNFDIFHELLVSQDSPLTLGPVGINDASGDEVNYVSYSPKRIVLRSKNVDACLLLVNDKYDPNWEVTVNGKPTPLLRCNYIMRGVQVPAGENNEIIMEFKPPLTGFWISAGALLAWIGLGLVLIVKRDKSSLKENNRERNP
jgi:hypothetical protein